MAWLSVRDLAALQAIRAAHMTETGTIHRAPLGPHTGDARLWPLHHTEQGALTASRGLRQNREGLRTETDQPQWVTIVGSPTQPGDLLHVRGRWWTVGAARAQTIQTASVFQLTEVIYGG